MQPVSAEVDYLPRRPVQTAIAISAAGLVGCTDRSQKGQQYQFHYDQVAQAAQNRPSRVPGRGCHSRDQQKQQGRSEQQDRSPTHRMKCAFDFALDV